MSTRSLQTLRGNARVVGHPQYEFWRTFFFYNVVTVWVCWPFLAALFDIIQKNFCLDIQGRKNLDVPGFLKSPYAAWVFWGKKV